MFDFGDDFGDDPFAAATLNFEQTLQRALQAPALPTPAPRKVASLRLAPRSPVVVAAGAATAADLAVAAPGASPPSKAMPFALATLGAVALGGPGWLAAKALGAALGGIGGAVGGYLLGKKL